MNKYEPSRTGLQSPCKRAVVSSILTGGSIKTAVSLRVRPSTVIAMVFD